MRWRRNLGWDCILRRRREHGTKWFLCTVHTYKFHRTCQNIKDRCSNLPYTTIPLQPCPSPPTSPLHPALTTSVPKPPRRHTKTIRNTHRHPPTTRPSIIVLATGNYPTAKKIRKLKPDQNCGKTAEETSALESRSIVFTVRSRNWVINRALLNWKIRMEREFQQRGLVLKKRNKVVSFRECLPRLGL